MNHSPTTKQTLWDFSLQFVTPTVRRLLANPVNSLALDISCGDGKRVVAAAQLFSRSIGIDAPQLIEVAKKLHETPSNAEYRERESAKLPVESGSVHFAYTLRGLTYFDSIDRFDDEIAEVARVLKPGGVAMLWFGRITRLPFSLNPAAWLRGYSHDPDHVVPLKVRQSRVRKSLRKAGLKHAALSTPLHPDTSWRLFRGGDLSYVTAVKPG